MTDAVFTDESRAPTARSIRVALGQSSAAWRALFTRLHAEHPELEETWRYYPDGKSWLLKVTRKAKTVFWLSVQRGRFRVAFYFPERLAGTLLESDLPDRVKAGIRDRAPGGTLFGVRVEIGPKSAVGDVMALVAMKIAAR